MASLTNPYDPPAVIEKQPPWASSRMPWQSAASAKVAANGRSAVGAGVGSANDGGVEASSSISSKPLAPWMTTVVQKQLSHGPTHSPESQQTSQEPQTGG